MSTEIRMVIDKTIDIDAIPKLVDKIHRLIIIELEIDEGMTSPVKVSIKVAE